MAISACAVAGISAGALLHPSLLTPEDIAATQAPLLLLPAGNDPDMLPFMEELKKKPFGAQCGHHRFEEQQHGWSVRGDLNIAAQHRDVYRAIRLVAEFFSSTLKA